MLLERVFFGVGNALENVGQHLRDVFVVALARGYLDVLLARELEADDFVPDFVVDVFPYRGLPALGDHLQNIGRELVAVLVFLVNAKFSMPCVGICRLFEQELQALEAWVLWHLCPLLRCALVARGSVWNRAFLRFWRKDGAKNR